MFAGLLGGHLSFTKGVGPDQTVFDPGPEEWTPAGPADAVSEGELTRVVVDDTPVVIQRENERFYALHDRCSHRGCSLSDGKVEEEDLDVV